MARSRKAEHGDAMKHAAARLAALVVVLLARFVTAARAVWSGVEPVAGAADLFRQPCSHGDFVLIWTVLPPQLRRLTRPVAAADYWLTVAARGASSIRNVFNAVLIDRDPETGREDPVGLMVEALDEGASLILFPEGTRNTTRRATAAVQERALSSRPGAAGVRAGAGLDREPEPRHAEGRDRAGAADLHRHLRRGDPRLAEDEARRPSSPGAARRCWPSPPAGSAPVSAADVNLLLPAGRRRRHPRRRFAGRLLLRRRLTPEGGRALVENLNARIRGLVGDGRPAVAGLHRRQGRRHHALRALLVRGAARVHDPDPHAPGRSLGAGGGLLRRPAGAVLSGLDRLVRALFDLHPGLRLPAAADHRGAARRYRRLPRPHRRECSGR